MFVVLPGAYYAEGQQFRYGPPLGRKVLPDLLPGFAKHEKNRK